MDRNQPHGHDARHRGIQRHSIGDHFPLAVVPVGRINALRYRVENIATGAYGVLRHTAHEALIDLYSIRVNAMMAS